jgi:hypothetical protein
MRRVPSFSSSTKWVLYAHFFSDSGDISFISLQYTGLNKIHERRWLSRSLIWVTFSPRFSTKKDLASATPLKGQELQAWLWLVKRRIMRCSKPYERVWFSSLCRLAQLSEARLSQASSERARLQSIVFQMGRAWLAARGTTLAQPEARSIVLSAGPAR